MPKYRPYRLANAPAVEIADKAEMLRHLNSDLARWGIQLEEDDVNIVPLGRGEDRQVVQFRNKQIASGQRYFGDEMGPDWFGVAGFLSAPGI